MKMKVLKKNSKKTHASNNRIGIHAERKVSIESPFSFSFELRSERKKFAGNLYETELRSDISNFRNISLEKWTKNPIIRIYMNTKNWNIAPF